MKLKFILLLQVLVIMYSCASKTNSNYIPLQQVSLIQLISNPEKYDSKKIELKGFFTISTEENALYLSKDDYDNTNTKNSIWLSVSKEFIKSQNIEPPYKGYISVEGIFLKNKKNSNSHFSGTITNIDYMSRITSRE